MLRGLYSEDRNDYVECWLVEKTITTKLQFEVEQGILTRFSLATRYF